MNINTQMEEALKRNLNSKETLEFIDVKAKEMIKKAIINVFANYGGIGDELENNIKKIMVPMIEKYDYSKYEVKLDKMLTEVINEQMNVNSEILKKFKTLVTENNKETTIEEIVKKWIEYAEHNIETFELNPCDDDPTVYETVEVEISYYFKNSDPVSYCTIELVCEKDKSLNKKIEFFNYKFSLSSNDDKEYFLSNHGEEMTINSIVALDEFDLFIHSLKMNKINFDINEKELDKICENFDSFTPFKEVEYGAL